MAGQRHGGHLPLVHARSLGHRRALRADAAGAAGADRQLEQGRRDARTLGHPTVLGLLHPGAAAVVAAFAGRAPRRERRLARALARGHRALVRRLVPSVQYDRRRIPSLGQDAKRGARREPVRVRR